MTPKLSDFGLARMLGMEESKVFTDVRGTIGYMDPEYMSNAKLTSASDIYSFGIVTLQLLSGQRVIELDLDARDQLTRKVSLLSLTHKNTQEFYFHRQNIWFTLHRFMTDTLKRTHKQTHTHTQMLQATDLRTYLHLHNIQTRVMPGT